MATYHLRVKNDSKPNGNKVSGKGHANYILREGEENKQTDCVFKSMQLPSWAKGSAQKFFSAADRYEDKGSRRYKEIELSLPNELTLEQNREIVDRFVAKYLTNHYYALAIHDKAGEVSGERHPHVHIMFSERLIDDVEKIKERPACKYFRRAAKALKGEKVASFERRQEHGAPKDKRWHSKKFLCEIREEFAKIQNEVLAKNGFSVRVDHRSLKAQKEKAEREGDSFLSKVCDRIPEQYIGIIASHSTSEEVKDLKHSREVKQKKFDELFKDDFRSKIELENEVRFELRRAELMALVLIQSANFESNPKKTKIIEEFEKVKAIKKELMRGDLIKEQVQFQYLSKADRKFLTEYKNLAAQKFNLEKLLRELVRPSEKQVESLKAFSEIESAVQAEILSLRKAMVEKYPQVQAIERKLQSPSCRKNIGMATHNILQSSLDKMQELKMESEKLMKLVEEEKVPQEIFTLSEVRENLRLQCRELKVAYEKSVDERNMLMWKVISPKRAKTMAQNIFAKGGFKKLHEEERQYEKAAKIFERAKSEYHQNKLGFQNTVWKNSGEKIQAHYYLVREKVELESKSEKLAETKKSLDVESAGLEQFCSSEDAREKIALIAAGILRKNLKVVQKYERVKIRAAELLQKLKVAKNRLESLKEKYPRERKNKFYRVISPNASVDKNLALAMIADALNGDEKSAQLVAYSSSNSLEMDKTWSLMSELDKDALILKKLIREL